MNNRPESEILRACLDCLKLRGVYAWRNNTTGVYDPTRKCFRTFNSLRGVGDILGILDDGRFMSIECKRAGKKPTPDQVAFMAEVNRRGGLAFVARSVDDVLAALDGTT